MPEAEPPPQAEFYPQLARLVHDSSGLMGCLQPCSGFVPILHPPSHNSPDLIPHWKRQQEA